MKPSGDIFVKSVLTEDRAYELVINARDQGTAAIKISSTFNICVLELSGMICCLATKVS